MIDVPRYISNHIVHNDPKIPYFNHAALIYIIKHRTHRRYLNELFNQLSRVNSLRTWSGEYINLHWASYFWPYTFTSTCVVYFYFINYIYIMFWILL